MIGSFRLMVRRDGSKDWGELRLIKYDEKSVHRNHRRDEVLGEMKGIRDRWGSNYAQFSDAAFRIVESSIHFQGDKIISGPLK